MTPAVPRAPHARALIEGLGRVSTPLLRAALFRTALIEVHTRPSEIARACGVSDAVVSLVLQGRQPGGEKGREVQEEVARRLRIPVDLLFPIRGPATTGRAAWSEASKAAHE